MKNIIINIFHYTRYNVVDNSVSLLNERLLQVNPVSFRQRIVLPNNLPLYKSNNIS